eukprot:TRINITY_DN1748_c0_g1_i1.p1 TRINITY_DN1748_c0_g1~~TRINITY_DN1748_c0_g1_i1.p1  ORF type:complete len:629 (+),score=98.41 TRINITY_DN1748_c0_g1_i1:47-1933(+)
MWGHVGSGNDATEQHEERKENHACTDLPCCVLFVVCMIGWAMCYGYGLTNGNPKRMFRGIQSVGNQSYVCGLDAPFENKGLVYWCMQSSFGGSVQNFQPVCVSACPGETNTTTLNPVQSMLPTVLQTPPPAECVGTGYTGYQTFTFLDRYCLPNTASSPGIDFHGLAGGQLSSKMSQFMEALSGLEDSVPVLVMAFVLSLVFGYLYLVALKCCAEPLIWATMLSSVVGFAIMGGYLFTNADSLHEQAAQNVNIPQSVTGQTKLGAQIAGGVFMFISVVLALVMCCFCSSIKTAARVIEVSCETMWEMPVLLLSPLLKALMKGASYAIIFFGFLYLFTTAQPVPIGPDGMSRQFDYTGTQKWIIAYYLFASLWLLAWINAYYQFIVAFIVADYYYAPFHDDGDKDVNQCEALCGGMYHGAVTHSGSLAFGSLLIAIIEFLQKCLEYAEKKNQEAGDNKIVKCLIWTALCCLSCIKQTIEFINKNAYIDIAVTGVDGFCDAGRHAIQVITSSAGTMAILNGATMVFSLFGSMLITLLTTTVTYFTVSNGSFSSVTGPGEDQVVPDKVMVCVVAAFISMGVSWCFMNVFDMTSDTLVYCVGYDFAVMHHQPNTAPVLLRDLWSDASAGNAS